MSSSNVKRALVIYLGAHPVYEGFISGGERHLMEVIKRFDKIGVDFLTSKSGASNCRRYGIDAKYYINDVPFESILCRSDVTLPLLYFMRTLRSFFTVLTLPFQYPILICNTHFLYDVLTSKLLCWKSKNSKVIVLLHHVESSPLKRSGYHRLFPSLLTWFSLQISIKLIRSKQYFIFTFRFANKIVRNLGIPPERIKNFQNGVSLADIARIRSTSQIYDACFLGRLAPIKGIFDLIDIWKQFCKKTPSAKLAIIGGGQTQYVNELNITIKESGLSENVIMLGPLSETEKYSVLKASKMFIFPSYEEGFAMTVLEALACGLPTVAYDLPAYNQFGSAVLRVNWGDKSMLATFALRLSKDEKMRRELSSKARAVANDFDWDVLASREQEMIIECLQK